MSVDARKKGKGVAGNRLQYIPREGGRPACSPHLTPSSRADHSLLTGIDTTQGTKTGTRASAGGKEAGVRWDKILSEWEN